MSKTLFKPTPEQDKVIRHEGSAFITACPGAGKTRVMIERVRELLKSRYDGRGIAFLSFTRAAVFELDSRLRQEALIGSPVFPNFIGTFDSFIWQFLVAPFGISDTESPPRLIPDKRTRKVQPYTNAQQIPLSCFDSNGKIIASAALRSGFDTGLKNHANIKGYETAARKMLARFIERGELDFDDARDQALKRLADKEFSKRFSSALAARFREIIVDEAQDCNPADLEIIEWFREAGISTKVVCDPHQSIFEFRGGVTEHLFTVADKFEKNDRLCMSGNFRSSRNICRTIMMLRAIEYRNIVDEAYGVFKDEQAHVYILSYKGKAVPNAISGKFIELLNNLKIDIKCAPVLAATRNSASNAIGQPVVKAKRDLTFRLAEAVSNFYFAFDSRNQKSAIEAIHKVILELEGRLTEKSYHQCIVEHKIQPNEWRAEVMILLRALRIDSQEFPIIDAWHSRAKELLAPHLSSGGVSISQKMKKNKEISAVLRPAPAECPPAKTIHSVKGLEFPAVCVVTVATTLKGILDYLETGVPAEKAELARELYVAASRAQRLLVFAVPRSQSARFTAFLQSADVAITVLDI